MAGDLFAQSPGDASRVLDPKEVDAFLAVNSDGTVTIFCGKVDLGQGLRIAIPQIAAEELGIGVDKIKYVEGDTALTPDQGRTSGSNGIQRGGMQIRLAAATARKALVDLAAQRLNLKANDLVVAEGLVRPKSGGAGISFADLIGGRRFDVKLDPNNVRLKDPAAYTIVGKSLPRPDVPAKCTGRHVYMHDFTVPGMLHARVIRPPAVGASLTSVDEFLDQGPRGGEGGPRQGFAGGCRRGRMDSCARRPRFAGTVDRRLGPACPGHPARHVAFGSRHHR